MKFSLEMRAYTMSVLDTFAQLRSHLERCRILLDTLAAEEMPREVEDHIAAMQESVRTTIIRNIKSVVNYKNDKKIPITSTFPVAAEVIKESVEYCGDLEVADKELEELHRKCKDAQAAKPGPKSFEKVQHHPDTRLNKIMQVAIEMGGLPIEKYIPKFKMEKPPMELWDIYTFIQQLKTKRENSGRKYETGVYAHLCEHGTVYVGLSKLDHMGNGIKTVEESVRMRLASHRNWHECSRKAYMTGLFRVLSMLFYFPGDKNDEDLLVYLLNECLPKFRVRGGQFAGIGVTSIPSMDVSEIKYKLLENSE